MCTGSSIRYNMHSTVAKVLPPLNFEKSWVLTLRLIFTFALHPIIDNAQFGIDRLAQHHMYPISKKSSSIAHLQSEINATIFLFLRRGFVPIGRFWPFFLSLQYIILLYVYGLSK